ncbi:ATP-dependent DNA helicase PIF4 [Bienertia sinuspersici]
MMQRQTRNPELFLDPEELQNLGLLEIEHVLNKVRKTLADFPDMPRPSNPLHNALNRLIRYELDYDTIDEFNRFEALVRGLNTNQYKVYTAICDAHHNDISGLFFVYGSGGMGKTYLWNTLISKFRSAKKIVLSVASSGIAALLLPGGKTAHFTFKIPFNPEPNSVCGFKKDSYRADLNRDAALIIWDEAPMTHRLAFEAED